MSDHHDEKPHLPAPSLWPIGFAIGIACVLVGLVVSWPAVAIGAVITAIFGFLWIRDVSRDMGGAPDVEPAEVDVADRPSAGVPAAGQSTGAAFDEPGIESASDEEVRTYGRAGFLTAATIGAGAVVGGLIAVPSLGFAVLPSFTEGLPEDIDLGPLTNFPEGQFVVTTYLENAEAGGVTRRTAYVRNNGQVEGEPSFTILFSRCVHLGCPIQPQGPPVGEKKTYGDVTLEGVQPAGFGCPCHGGAYDTEGNRTAGPPVRALDRFKYSIRNGNLILGEAYSVGTVEGTGAEAQIAAYDLAAPGVHVDGLEAWLYPIPVPRGSG